MTDKATDYYYDKAMYDPWLHTSARLDLTTSGVVGKDSHTVEVEQYE